MTGAHVVPVDALRARLEDRRRQLATLLEAGDQRTPDHSVTHALEELDVISTLVDELVYGYGYHDRTTVTRPGVLLVGAGIRGDVTIAADLETLDLGVLSDRDLAVYAGLVGHVLDRVTAEQTRRLYGAPVSTLEQLAHRIGSPLDEAQEASA